ncbi:MAG TPA: YciI family protein [Jiangellaceae bacterium]
MRYAILIMDTESGKQVPPADAEAWYQEIMAWYEKRSASGEIVAGAGAELEDASKARTIRSTGVTDGPFIEAKEVIGGFSVLEAHSMDDAVEIAKTWPGVDRGWITIEVRPVVS